MIAVDLSRQKDLDADPKAIRWTNRIRWTVKKAR